MKNSCLIAFVPFAGRFSFLEFVSRASDDTVMSTRPPLPSQGGSTRTLAEKVLARKRWLRRNLSVSFEHMEIEFPLHFRANGNQANENGINISTYRCVLYEHWCIYLSRTIRTYKYNTEYVMNNFFCPLLEQFCPLFKNLAQRRSILPRQ